MSSRLSQLRAGIAALIAENPTVISISRRPLVDDGFDGTVSDPTGTPMTTLARVRISHQSASVPANRATSAGIDTSLSLYVLTDYLAPVQEGDTFTALDRVWKAGPVNVMRSEGRIYATEAPLVAGETS